MKFDPFALDDRLMLVHCYDANIVQSFQLNHHHHHHHHKIVQIQVSNFLFLFNIVQLSVVFSEIPSCCSVSKPKDYEYIPYESKVSSSKNDYVSIILLFFAMKY